jgi:hypothetical protein
MTRRHSLWIFRSLAALLCLSSAAVLVAADADRAGDSARWYKGNTHCHTFWSDGNDFPEMVADWYKGHGYDFLAISDHNQLMAGEKWAPVDGGKRPVPSAVVERCQRRFGPNWLELRGENGHREVKLKTFDELCAKLVEPGKFLLIQNEEIDTTVGGRAVHLNAINLAQLLKAKPGKSVAEAISLNVAMIDGQAERLGRPMFAQVNHPTWKLYDIPPEDLAAAATARFVEVRNGGIGGLNRGDATHPSADKLWDIANTIRIARMKAPPLFGIGADDSHRYPRSAQSHADPGKAWIMVHSKQLAADALIDAVKRGDFYTSTGVTLRKLSYDAKERTIAVEVQAEPGVGYTIEFIGTLEGADPTGQPVEAATGLKPNRPGRTYSPEVGKVLASVQGVSATYRLTGKELYVRAVVRADKSRPNAPTINGELPRAWGQPVGWEERLLPTESGAGCTNK